MTAAARARRRLTTPIALASCVAWVVLALGGAAVSVPAICLSGVVLPPGAAIAATLTWTPPAMLGLAWGLMLVAMMAPLLPGPLGHLRDRSLPKARPRAMALFLAGYFGVWMLAGMPIVALAVTAQLAAPGWTMPLAVFTAAGIWQASPARQTALNRCHARPALPAFGAAAWGGALSFGLHHGLACVVVCGPLMLATLATPTAHVPAMALVALWLGAERLERPNPPRWSLRIPKKLARAAHNRAALVVRTEPG